MTKDGVNWPLDEGGEKRSTTGTGKKIWVAAIEAENSSVAEAITRESSWRKNYQKLIYDVVCEQGKSRDKALGIAKKGLDEVYKQFTFIRNEKETLLVEAMSIYKEPGFKTVEICGTGEKKPIDFGVAVEQLQKLAEKGEIEPDVVESIRILKENEDSYVEALKDTWFVILGATSELCPLGKLLDLGLNVVAISRPSPKRQEKVIELAKKSCGKLIVPVRIDTAEESENKNKDTHEVCGADVLTDTPELRTWLVSLQEEKQLVIGSYIYLDGAMHVVASVAMDAILKGVLEKRPDTALTYLVTPATIYPIPLAAAEDAKNRFDTAPILDSIIGVLGSFKQNKPAIIKHDEGKESEKSIAMFNGLANFQGPSYALAKTMQNWRCLLARQSSVVSANVTPSCATESVFHVAGVERVFKGMKYRFSPLTYYYPKFTKDLMAALLIYDLTHPHSPANPNVVLDNPNELFLSNGCHTGMWRSPYEMESIGKAAYVYGMFS